MSNENFSAAPGVQPTHTVTGTATIRAKQDPQKSVPDPPAAVKATFQFAPPDKVVMMAVTDLNGNPITIPEGLVTIKITTDEASGPGKYSNNNGFVSIQAPIIVNVDAGWLGGKGKASVTMTTDTIQWEVDQNNYSGSPEDRSGAVTLVGKGILSGSGAVDNLSVLITLKGNMAPTV